MRRLVLPVLFMALLIGAVSYVGAGGPRAVNGLGQPMAWDTVGPVVYHPDPGPLGLLTNAQARALLAEAFAEWENGPASITFSEGAPLALDVNGAGFAFSNPSHYQNFYRVNADGKSPVIFDHDGSIIEAIFGIGARFEILGVAGLDSPIAADPEITGASIIINGAFYDGVGLPDSPEDLTLDGLKAAMVHEIGHFINLDHTMLNHELAMDDSPGNDIYVPTMFPLAVQDEGALENTNLDDVQAAEQLYPTDESLYSIEGTIQRGGSIMFQGANVVIRLASDPLMTAYSRVSGGLYFPCNPGSTCDPCNTACDPGNPVERGKFRMGYLQPAIDYKVCVEQIDTRFSVANGTFVGPLATPPFLPGPEECWDSTDAPDQTDDPDDFDLLNALLGPSIEIQLNALPSADPFEPNDTLQDGATLDDLSGGSDTAPGVLAVADLDVFEIFVTAGQRVAIDLDAAELGSPLDAVVGFYDDSDTLVALSDDAVDPDSRAFSTDPALELIAGFTGPAKIVLSSFPDLDQDGSGGVTTGGYWLRVEVTSDADDDGIADLHDICPADPRDDLDRDGFCFGADNCPTHANPTQLVPTKFNGPLTSGGGILNFVAVGSTIVYRADQDTDETWEVYGARMDAGPAVKLNDPFPAGGDAWAIAIAPDEATVVYTAEQDVDQVRELYAVPIGGGPTTKLNGALVPGGIVIGNVFISPDSTRVVYTADQEVVNVVEIYSVPIGGGAAVKLNTGGGASGPVISPDSSRVLYIADEDVVDVTELYSVPISGGVPVKVNGALPPGGDVLSDPAISPNSASVVYVVTFLDPNSNQIFEIYGAPIGGGTANKLNGTLVPDGSVFVFGSSSFLVSADSTTVTYMADQDTDEVIELYSVPIGGGLPVKLNGALVAGGNVVSHVHSPDGSRVIYRSDQVTDEEFNLYSVPIGGGTPVRLNAPLPPGGDVLSFTTADSTRALYVADQDVNDVVEIYSVPIGGGTPTHLNGQLVVGGDVTGVFLGDPTLYRADQEVDNIIELYRVPVTGGTPTKLNANLPAFADVSGALLSADLSTVVYRADQDTDGITEFYAVDLIAGSDSDGDGVLNGCDVCVLDGDSGQEDTDGNGLGDACQTCALGTDPDGDDICGTNDNCPTIPNPEDVDSDFDGDGAGQACDADDDGDGLADVVETDTGTFVSSDDTGTDPLDADSDNDGVADGDEVASGTDPNDAGEIGLRVPFHAGRAITTTANGASAVYAVDVDGDGDVDVLSASQFDAQDKIFWYENDGASPPTFTVHTITATVDEGRSVFAADVDGDGDVDVLSAASVGDSIAWYENDGASPPGWTERTISTIADGANSVFAADVDGDGDVDALSASILDDKIAWYENNGVSPPGWTERTISTTADTALSVFAADVDGDGDVDVLSASESDDTIAWYENDGASPPGWTERTISTTADGARSVYAADVNGDGNMDVLSASELDDKLAWYENDGASPPGFTAHTISTAADGARSVFATDVDGDGDVDALSASFADDTIAWYENDGASPPGFTARTNSTAADGAVSVFAADVDGDGDVDALSASAFDDTVAWYENRAIHRNAAFPSESIVGTMGGWANSINLDDLDGDGDIDVVTGALTTRWHENLDGSGTAWSTSTVQTFADLAGGTAVADLDRDGDRDILSIDGVFGDVSWAENTAGDGSAWSVHPIPHVGGEGTAVNVADIDRDGDPDVVTTMLSGRLSWHENTAGDASAWSEHPIDAHLFNWDNLPVDLDGDGDVDIVNIGGTGAVWYENTSGDGSTWSAGQTIGALDGNYRFLGAGDLDGDGDPDVLLCSASLDTIEWYENASGDGSTWVERTITAIEQGANSMAIGDVDADGDLDVLSTGGTSDRVVLHENVAGDGSVWSVRVVSLLSDAPVAVGVGDIDGDGHKDVTAIGFNDDEVAWYRGRGGQFTLETTLPAGAPATIADGSTTALLAIELTSNGRSGDSDVELATLELLVTNGFGATLSSDEANRIIARLRVYRDTGSGIFERGIDPLVATVETLELSPQVIEFAPGDPRVRVAAGQSRTFFVVAEATTTASAQIPGSFRLTHVTASSSKARDATTGTLLQMEYAANAGTPTIGMVADAMQPFVISVFPADHAVDVSLSTSVLLFLNEPVDASSAAAGVALYKDGVKIPGRVDVEGSAITIDPESPLALDSDYLVQVTPRLRGMDANPAIPFVSTFDTTDSATSGVIAASDIGGSGGGATLGGSNADDNTGFAAAALGDVNGTLASGGIADLIIGAPNADAGAVDAGSATLVFGAPGLQSNAGAVTRLTYRTATAQHFVGETVARAGDLNGDTVQDFLIGAPHSDQSGPDAGVAYLVFGDAGLDELAPATLDLDNLASCAVPTLCGVKFTGADPNGLAGAALSWAGDVNGDDVDDIIIGAPGASPGGRAGAGRVYLIYGPLAAGTIPLSQVGSTTPGLVFNGETAGDSFGASVSLWPDQTGDGFDDLLIGAPGATALDPLGASISDAGYVYAIQGGERAGHLDDNATPGVIEMSRVANGAPDQVAGMVFIGAMADMNLGRSVTGAVDLDGNGVNDILIAGNGVAFAIPGDDPKTRVGSTQTPGTSGGGGLRAGLFSALGDFGAVMYTTGNDDPLTVGAAGDLNNDGYDDFIIGSPLADGAAGIDSGQAYVILGSPAPGSDEQSLDDVGGAIAGFIVEGAEPGDKLGASVGGGADLNADGVDDGLVGAPFADTNPATPANAGETYVISPLRPAEVVTLSLIDLGGGVTRLEWSVPDLAATYNIYRGLLSSLVPAGAVKTSDMTQLACGIATDADLDLLPDHDDAGPLPPAGDAWFYLVTAENFQGEGPLGPGGMIPPRVNDLQCP